MKSHTSVIVAFILALLLIFAVMRYFPRQNGDAQPERTPPAQPVSSKGQSSAPRKRDSLPQNTVQQTSSDRISPARSPQASSARAGALLDSLDPEQRDLIISGMLLPLSKRLQLEPSDLETLREKLAATLQTSASIDADMLLGILDQQQRIALEDAFDRELDQRAQRLNDADFVLLREQVKLDAHQHKLFIMASQKAHSATRALRKRYLLEMSIYTALSVPTLATIKNHPDFGEYINTRFLQLASLENQLLAETGSMIYDEFSPHLSEEQQKNFKEWQLQGSMIRSEKSPSGAQGQSSPP